MRNKCSTKIMIKYSKQGLEYFFGFISLLNGFLLNDFLLNDFLLNDFLLNDFERLEFHDYPTSAMLV